MRPCIWNKLSSPAGKQIRFYYKLLIATVLGILLLWIFSDFLVKFIPQLARFKQFAFSGNGRDVLRKAYHEASADTNIWGRLAGIPMTKRYLQYITVEFSHSFSENSYMGISLIFGLSGVLIFLYMLCRLVKRISCAPEAMVLCIWLFTFFFQDTLLSVQTGILFVFSTFIVCGKHRELLGKLPKEG